MEKFIENYNEQAKKLFQILLKRNREENIVFSPYSVMTLLAIAAQAASSSTRNEILEAIAAGMNYEELEEAVKNITSSIAESSGLNSANAAIIKKKFAYSLKSDYADRLRAAFDGDVITTDNIMNSGNQWVDEKTCGMIRSVFNESVNKMDACLLNAVFFEKKWEGEYGEEDIHEGQNFTNVDGSISKTTMLSSTENIYLENKFFTGFVKSYQEHEFSFVALLPKKKNPDFLMRAIKNTNVLNQFPERRFEDVHVKMPEFKTEFTARLDEVCKELGMNELFQETADFSNMCSESLKMDSFIHEAKIEVNRKGTKAAGFTGAFGIYSSIRDERYHVVTLDRPFVYSIVHSRTGIPVFTGIVNKL